MALSGVRKQAGISESEAIACAHGSAVASFQVMLPAHLHRFGRSVTASLCGPTDAPLIVVLGGISAHAFPYLRPDGQPGWWPGLTGEGKGIDPQIHRILGLDFIADATGRTAPTTLDQAQVIAAALDQLSVARAAAVVGASYGGMIALSFGQHFADRVERLVVISADARAHPASTSVRELQRRIVALGLASGSADEALSIARGLAMLSYRTPQEFEARFTGGIDEEDCLSCSPPGAYLRARGDAFVNVMTPERFLSLSASIDRHRVDPARIAVPALLIGAETDQLVHPSQMRALADRLAGPNQLHLLPSLYGHDMFLKDADLVSNLAGPFLRAEA
jgi:homoserine O-acetyltransferase